MKYFEPSISSLQLVATILQLGKLTSAADELHMSQSAASHALKSLESQILWRVRLPLALPVILAGIRTATVITIGVATIAAAIGAGGLGIFIFRGVAMVSNAVILAGAVPAALLAILADILLARLERRLKIA